MGLGVQFSCGHCYCATRISSCLALIVLALSPIVNLQLLVWWVVSDASWSYRVGRLGGEAPQLAGIWGAEPRSGGSGGRSPPSSQGSGGKAPQQDSSSS